MGIQDSYKTIAPYLQGSWLVFCLASIIVLFGLFTTYGDLVSPLAPSSARDPFYIADNYKVF